MTSRLRILLAGLGLILAGNAVALIGVAYNRSGEPDAVVELSQRELAAPYAFRANKENSGLTLTLSWRIGEARRSASAGKIMGAGVSWLGKDKLAELGFDVSAAAGDQADLRVMKQLPRDAWIVLEFDGPAWQEALAARAADLAEANERLASVPDNTEFKQRVKQAQQQLEAEQNSNSRLFAIDVGPDRDRLRSRYPDRARHLVLPGEIRLGYTRDGATGFFSRLDASAVHVPLAERTVIVPGAPYTVTVAFGKRAEPWIVEARK